MREESQCRSEAVVACLVDEPPAGAKEAVKLAARRMKYASEPQPCEPPIMAVFPWLALTRLISLATKSSALSHDTGTNRSRPRPAPVPAPGQPSRTIGAEMRVGECTLAGIASISADGSGSRSNGRTPTTRPSSTLAKKAPQWEWLRTQCAVMIAYERRRSSWKTGANFKAFSASPEDIRNVAVVSHRPAGTSAAYPSRLLAA